MKKEVKPSQTQGAKGTGTTSGKPRRKWKTACILLCACLLFCMFTSAGLALYAKNTASQDLDVLDLDNLREQGGFAQGPMLYAQSATGEWQAYQSLNSQAQSGWVTLQQMPQDLVQAVLAIVQPGFYKEGAASPLLTVLRGLWGGGGSASTIEQQLARQLAGNRADEDNIFYRKLRQLGWALLLGQNYTKDILLEAYLNTVYLGENALGMGNAAYLYFGKEVENLTMGECATLAGMIAYPGNYNPFQYPEACRERRNAVLWAMQNHKMISKEEAQKQIDTPLVVMPHKYTGPVLSYFTDYVYQCLAQDLMEQKGISPLEVNEYLHANSLKVYTTVDVALQQHIEKLYAQKTGILQQTGANNPQAACVVLNFEGEICAMVGGVGEKEQNMVLNRALTPRSPGTALRPFSPYAVAIEQGKAHYSTMLQDSPVGANFENTPPNWPRNLNDEATEKPMPLAAAFINNTNTVAAQLGMQVGIEEMADFLTGPCQFANIVTGAGDFNDMALGPLALGSLTMGVTPLELAAASQIFGNGGMYHSPRPYTHVTDAQGEIVLQASGQAGQALSPETAHIMRQLLLQSTQSNFGGLLPANLAVAGQTGVGADQRDQWFTGVMPGYVCTVWFGKDEPEKLETGIEEVIQQLWLPVAQALPEGQEFAPMPDGIVCQNYCSQSGGLAGAACPNPQEGCYIEGNMPQPCTAHGG